MLKLKSSTSNIGFSKSNSPKLLANLLKLNCSTLALVLLPFDESAPKSKEVSHFIQAIIPSGLLWLGFNNMIRWLLISLFAIPLYCSCTALFGCFLSFDFGLFGCFFYCFWFVLFSNFRFVQLFYVSASFHHLRSGLGSSIRLRFFLRPSSSHVQKK